MLNARIEVVVSNVSDAAILERARVHGIPTVHIPGKGRCSVCARAFENIFLLFEAQDLLILLKVLGQARVFDRLLIVQGSSLSLILLAIVSRV